MFPTLYLRMLDHSCDHSTHEKHGKLWNAFLKQSTNTQQATVDKHLQLPLIFSRRPAYIGSSDLQISPPQIMSKNIDTLTSLSLFCYSKWIQNISTFLETLVQWALSGWYQSHQDQWCWVLTLWSIFHMLFPIQYYCQCNDEHQF